MLYKDQPKYQVCLRENVKQANGDDETQLVSHKQEWAWNKSL
jgi:hypothetical protein